MSVSLCKFGEKASNFVLAKREIYHIVICEALGIIQFHEFSEEFCYILLLRVKGTEQWHGFLVDRIRITGLIPR